MSRSSKYGIRELLKDFPSDKKFLEFAFDLKHGRVCSCGGEYSLRKGRKSFQCSGCRFEIAPLAESVFEKSKTPLALWLHAALLFSNAKSGISAKQLERHLAVTYKNAWRMLHMMRGALRQGTEKLSGIVETDGAYLGGKRKGYRSRSEAILSKPLALAALERGGKTRVRLVSGTGAIPTGAFITGSVDGGTRLLSDKHGSYTRLKGIYKLQSVNHSQKEYVRGDVHVNTVESFWSHVKRSIRGTYKNVSKQHLQSYLDAFAFHRDNAGNDKERFFVLLGMLLTSSKSP